jgi:hypothetical protein
LSRRPRSVLCPLARARADAARAQVHQLVIHALVASSDEPAGAEVMLSAAKGAPTLVPTPPVVVINALSKRTILKVGWLLSPFPSLPFPVTAAAAAAHRPPDAGRVAGAEPPRANHAVLERACVRPCGR